MLVTLLASAGITLVLTLVLPQVLFFHLAIDVLLAGYVFLLVQRRKLAEERATKVRYMAPVQARRHATVPCAASSRRSARRPSTATIRVSGLARRHYAQPSLRGCSSAG